VGTVGRVILLHFCPRADWERASEDGEYRAESLASEGFVHCSTAAQVADAAAAHARGQAGLVLLAIDPERVDAPVRWEPPAEPRDADDSGDAEGTLFPHVYGPIPIAAVTAVHAFPPDADGSFRLPPALDLGEGTP
jgi:uncharacterized protein (DUF952 family)